MTSPERKSPVARAEPPRLHPRNRHAGRYDFDALTAAYPTLTRFVRPNPYGERSIDFADPKAVKAFNRALLQCHYGIADWDIPRLPVSLFPGEAITSTGWRICWMQSNAGTLAARGDVHVLDIGTGANLVYPRRACRVSVAVCRGRYRSVGARQRTVHPHGQSPCGGSYRVTLQTEANAIFHGVVESEGVLI